MLSKRDELENLVSLRKPAAVALTETWLSAEVADAEVSIAGYTLFRCDRTGRIGGGTLLYVRDDIGASLVHKTIDSDGQYEGLWCRVKFSHRGYETVGVLYRSPGAAPSIMIEDLNRFAGGGHCLILGDFNVPMIDWDNDVCKPGADQFTKDIFSTVCELYLHQHVRDSTRTTTSSANILDLVFSPRESDVTDLQILPPIGKSDHSTVSFFWRRGAPQMQPTLKRRNIWKIPFGQMIAAAESIDWKVPSSNVDVLWNHFRDVFHGLINDFAPPWKPRTHAKGPPWFDRELRRLLRRRNRAWKYFRSTGAGYEYYKRLRNECSGMKLEKRRSFEENLAFDAQLSPKRLYAYFRRRTKVDSRIPTITTIDGDIDEDAVKADVFADYYGSVYTTEESMEDFNIRTSFCVANDDITENDVIDGIKRLDPRKSPGPDEIPPLLYHKLADIIADPLANLYTASLRSGKLPNEWKSALVTPMHKAGSRSQTANYRPVSLTCVACKIMEKIIALRIQKHMEDRGLLHDGQHGFRRRHSCITNLLLARESWVAARADGYGVDVVYIDLSKAFDKVPHRSLLVKLEAYGVNGDTLRWVEDFLSDRNFSVRVNTDLSSQRRVCSGVPQGSVLGPLLFIVYINDLLERIQSPCLMYADDIKIWREIRTEDDPEILQQDLDCLMSWSASWHLPINPDKCSYMHVGRDNEVNAYHLNGRLVTTTQCERDLGVMVSNTLKTAAHTNKVCAAARGILGAIRRSFIRLTPSAFTMLYASHVRPRLEYGGLAAYPITLGEMEQIERVQRAATRLVDDFAGKSYEERLHLLNLFPQSYRRVRGDLIMVRQILRENLSPDLRLGIVLRNDDRRRGHSLMLRKFSPGRLSAKYRLSHRAVNLWNSLPAAVVEEENDDKFKRLLDLASKFILTSRTQVNVVKGLTRTFICPLLSEYLNWKLLFECIK